MAWWFCGFFEEPGAFSGMSEDGAEGWGMAASMMVFSSWNGSDLLLL